MKEILQVKETCSTKQIYSFKKEKKERELPIASRILYLKIIHSFFLLKSLKFKEKREQNLAQIENKNSANFCDYVSIFYIYKNIRQRH